MLECRHRNENKHIVSDNELCTFAWAGYYANYTNIFVNGENYRVIHIADSSIEFKDGKCLPFGCYAIFKNKKEIRFFDDYNLRRIRKESPLEREVYCLSDEQFFKIA